MPYLKSKSKERNDKTKFKCQVKGYLMATNKSRVNKNYHKICLLPINTIQKLIDKITDNKKRTKIDEYFCLQQHIDKLIYIYIYITKISIH